tara:strand:+ start:2793 stop:3209 length:417 start_codon:yes stop_codon:yes gene_type:complete
METYSNDFNFISTSRIPGNSDFFRTSYFTDDALIFEDSNRSITAKVTINILDEMDLGYDTFILGGQYEGRVKASATYRTSKDNPSLDHGFLQITSFDPDCLTISGTYDILGSTFDPSLNRTLFLGIVGTFKNIRYEKP